MFRTEPIRSVGRPVGRGIAVLVFAAAAVALAQSQTADPPSRFLISSSAPVPAMGATGGEVVREIDDPHNGNRWLLIRDESHPGGPGLLVLSSAAGVDQRQFASGPIASGPIASGPRTAGPEAPAPVIRAGDRLIVEEHTPVVDARLEAVAMNPAAPGSALNARLMVGGKVVRAVAIGPGRATLQPEAAP